MISNKISMSRDGGGQTRLVQGRLVGKDSRHTCDGFKHAYRGTVLDQDDRFLSPR